MPVIKVMQGRQVVIPKELFEQLGLQVGDYLEVTIEQGKIVYVPKQLVDRDPWYWGAQGQRSIQQSLQEYEEGKSAGPFTSPEEALKALKRRRP